MGGYTLEDTIVAPASAPGGAPQAIVRISGPSARQAVLGLFHEVVLAGEKGWQSREVLSVHLAVPCFSSPVPALLYYWPEGGSYTGQELAEIHIIGSQPLVDAVVDALISRGCRLARPGEFTLRAFLAGRLDLTQAEAVLGVVDAADPGALDSALRQLAGGLSGPLRQLREDLLELVTLLEAGLDFPDEEDVVPLSTEALLARLEAAHARLWQLLRQLESRAFPDCRWRVIISGAPNVGKSSLFNCLLGREEALVFDRPGTTRDYLAVPWELEGMPVCLVDTAGIGLGQPADKGAWSEQVNRESGSPNLESVENPNSRGDPDARAEELAQEQIQEAEVEIFCIEASRPASAWEEAKIREFNPRRVVAITKADLSWHPNVIELAENQAPVQNLVITSARERRGIAELRQAVGEIISSSSGKAGEVMPSTALRCAAAMKQAVEAIRRARALAESGASEELIAAEARLALENIAWITGEVYTEDILDRIFSRFCIGK